MKRSFALYIISGIFSIFIWPVISPPNPQATFDEHSYTWLAVQIRDHGPGYLRSYTKSFLADEKLKAQVPPNRALLPMFLSIMNPKSIRALSPRRLPKAVSSMLAPWPTFPKTALASFAFPASAWRFSNTMGKSPPSRTSASTRTARSAKAKLFSAASPVHGTVINTNRTRARHRRHLWKKFRPSTCA